MCFVETNQKCVRITYHTILQPHHMHWGWYFMFFLYFSVLCRKLVESLKFCRQRTTKLIYGFPIESSFTPCSTNRKYYAAMINNLKENRPHILNLCESLFQFFYFLTLSTYFYTTRGSFLNCKAETITKKSADEASVFILKLWDGNEIKKKTMGNISYYYPARFYHRLTFIIFYLSKA